MALGHELFVAVAMVAGLGQVRRIHGAVGIGHGQHVVIAVAVGTDGDLRIAFQEQFFAVMARFVAGELVGRDAVKVHRLDIGVAGAAFFRRQLLVGDTYEAGLRRVCRGLIGLRGIAAVAFFAENALLIMDTALEIINGLRMAGHARIIFGNLGERRGQEKEIKKYER